MREQRSGLNPATEANLNQLQVRVRCCCFGGRGAEGAARAPHSMPRCLNVWDGCGLRSAASMKFVVLQKDWLQSLVSSTRAMHLSNTAAGS